MLQVVGLLEFLFQAGGILGSAAVEKAVAFDP